MSSYPIPTAISETTFSHLSNSNDFPSKIKKGQITNIIKIGNNFLILKIEDMKTKKIKINKDYKLKEMIEFERNRQLNQYSNIYFNKIKINYSIDEK